MSDTISPTMTSPATTLPAVDAADYAALTTGAALITRVRAGVLRLTDADRHDFLQRMTTNNIAVLRPGMSAVTELVVRPSRVAAITEALVHGGVRSVAEAATETRRVELGHPAPGAELTEEYTPLEGGLGWACAENKGCYTGQEIIARQITYDKVTKTLVGLHLSTPVAVGSEIMAENRPVGTVTSTANSPSLDAPIALAVVKRPHNTPGTLLHIGAATATVTDLPMV
jgi:folate-binding protein YgfZ